MFGLKNNFTKVKRGIATCELSVVVTNVCSFKKVLFKIKCIVHLEYYQICEEAWFVSNEKCQH